MKISDKSRGKFQKYKNNIKNKFHCIDVDTLKELDNITYMSCPDVRAEYYYLNNGVGTTIQINRFPKVIGRKILNVFKGYSDLTITLDMEHFDNREMIDFLDSKMDSMENENEISDKSKDRRNASNKMRDESQFINRINKTYENGKYVTMRMYVRAKSLEHLQSKVDWIHDQLKSRELFGAIQRNLLDNDLKALTSCDNTVKEITTTRSIANMMMSDNVMEIKPFMMALGETEVGLPYCPDFFNYINNRSYCVALLGVQGSGKSSLIKSIVQGALMRGEQVILLDVHNKEYMNIAKRYHIPSVNLDMTNSINPYQIYNNNEHGIIDKMVVADVVMLNRKIFAYVTEESDTTIISMYVNVITEMYEDYLGMNVDEIKDEQWFTASDIRKRIQQKMENNEYNESLIEKVSTLLEHLTMMINTYGYFFDSVTSIKIDITKSIRFDLSSLNIEGGGQLENSYFALIFSFLGKNLRQNERLNEVLERGKKVVRPIHPITMVAEETGTLFKNTETAKIFDVFMRQTRKARLSIIYAIHTMQDVIGGDEEHNSLIKSIFSLCPNYIIGQIDNKTAEILPEYVAGLSKSDSESAVGFTVEESDKEKRRKFLAYSIDSKKRIVFYSKVLPRQQVLFGGGK